MAQIEDTKAKAAGAADHTFAARLCADSGAAAAFKQ